MESMDIINIVWKRLDINGHRFSFKSLFTQDQLEVLIMDSENFKLYTQKQTGEEIQGLFKKLNPGLEAPVTKILSIVEKNFEENSNQSLSLQNEPNHSSLKIQILTKISGVKFNYQLDLEALDNLSVYRQLIHPMLLGYHESQRREHELIKIIEQKDRELEDYRAQGVKLSRSYLRTDIFNQEKFNDSIDKKSEFNKELFEYPDASLHTDLSHRIQQSCKRYFSETQVIGEVVDIVQNDSERSKVATKLTIDSNEEVGKEKDRLKELELKMKEEEAKKSKMNSSKKKKLF